MFELHWAFIYDTQNSGSTSAPRLRLAAQHGGRRESSLVGYIHFIFYVISRVICRRSEIYLEGLVSKSVPCQSKSNPRRCVRDFSVNGFKKIFKSFLSYFETREKSKKKSVYLICLSAVFANTISWMTLCCDLKCLVPDLFFFFYKFSLTYVYIYIDRKTHFHRKGEWLVKSSFV